MATTTESALQVKELMPSLTVNDLQKSITFFEGLGFAIDERDFRIAARMLNLLNVETVRLLSNNPEKVEGLEAAGIRVAERVALALPSNPHNAHYLATKRDRTGHIL